MSSESNSINQNDKEKVQELEIKFQLGECGCINSSNCRVMISRNHSRLSGRFIGDGSPNRDDQVVAGVLNLQGHSLDSYISLVKKRSDGNAIREARKADKKGYYSKPFARRDFIPDIVDINHSKEIRSGGKMKSAYLKSLQDMGGAPKKYTGFKPPECTSHYDVWWGIFKREEGYKQGDVVTGERLLAYIDLRRIGNYALYSLIIGHGDYLNDGVMYRLHMAVIEWLLEGGNPYANGLDYLVYGGYYQGGDGLRRWKKRFGYEPGYLVHKESAKGNVFIRAINKLKRIIAGR